ncbi:hypothetical protein Pelo_8126 [Pelomyxa schiedti]|nr:hypothetical protein Pelo_12182 [Pelomyxa schiedti]KAH3760050.1 hypothetical protein Pelo_8126 [Pelomyxa schiedti]
MFSLPAQGVGEQPKRLAALLWEYITLKHTQQIRSTFVRSHSLSQHFPSLMNRLTNLLDDYSTWVSAHLQPTGETELCQNCVLPGTNFGEASLQSNAIPFAPQSANAPYAYKIPTRINTETQPINVNQQTQIHNMESQPIPNLQNQENPPQTHRIRKSTPQFHQPAPKRNATRNAHKACTVVPISTQKEQPHDNYQPPQTPPQQFRPSVVSPTATLSGRRRKSTPTRLIGSPQKPLPQLFFAADNTSASSFPKNDTQAIELPSLPSHQAPPIDVPPANTTTNALPIQGLLENPMLQERLAEHINTHLHPLPISPPLCDAPLLLEDSIQGIFESIQNDPFFEAFNLESPPATPLFYLQQQPIPSAITDQSMLPTRLADPQQQAPAAPHPPLPPNQIQTQVLQSTTQQAQPQVDPQSQQQMQLPLPTQVHSQPQSQIPVQFQPQIPPDTMMVQQTMPPQMQYYEPQRRLQQQGVMPPTSNSIVPVTYQYVPQAQIPPLPTPPLPLPQQQQPLKCSTPHQQTAVSSNQIITTHTNNTRSRKRATQTHNITNATTNPSAPSPQAGHYQKMEEFLDTLHYE